MSRSTGRARSRRLREARLGRGWPFCEHCGAERIVGTAADLVASIRENLGSEGDGLADGVVLAARDTAPDDLIGVCPGCLCIAVRGSDHG